MEYTNKERQLVLKAIKNSRFFKMKDFTCQCEHCKQEAKVDPKYLEDTVQIRLHAFNKLVAFRKAINSHIKVISAYRCPKHRLEVSKEGSKYQAHMAGEGFDIRITTNFSRAKTIILAIRAGMNGVGINNKSVHIDARNWEAVWIYEGCK